MLILKSLPKAAVPGLFFQYLAINDKYAFDGFPVGGRLADQVHDVLGRPHVVGRGLDGDDRPIRRQDRRPGRSFARGGPSIRMCS